MPPAPESGGGFSFPLHHISTKPTKPLPPLILKGQMHFSPPTDKRRPGHFRPLPATFLSPHVTTILHPPQKFPKTRPRCAGFRPGPNTIPLANPNFIFHIPRQARPT